jgi:RecB family exonuclease
VSAPKIWIWGGVDLCAHDGGVSISGRCDREAKVARRLLRGACRLNLQWDGEHVSAQRLVQGGVDLYAQDGGVSISGRCDREAKSDSASPEGCMQVELQWEVGGNRMAKIYLPKYWIWRMG